MLFRRLLNPRLERETFMTWMYILECCDSSYYVGSTKDEDFDKKKINEIILILDQPGG